MIWLALLLALPAAAQVSSGGAYSLDRSALSAGGDPATGGNFSGSGAVGGNSGNEAVDTQVLVGGVYELRVGVLNPPPFSLQRSTSSLLSFSGGRVLVGIPANSIPVPNADLVAREDPATNPVTLAPAAIVSANQKLAANDPLSYVQAQNVWEFKVASDQGYYTGQFAAPLALSFTYTDADDDGIVDGTNPPLRAKALRVWTLDEATAQWIKVPGVTVDAATHLVSVPVYHFSAFAFTGASDSEVEAAYAFPVPFRPRGPDAGVGSGQTGTEAAGITFTNLPSEGAIDIYTLTGKRVRHLEIPFGLALPKLTWDVRNSAGQTVASGVYIWRLASRTASKTGRLMVIR